MCFCLHGTALYYFVCILFWYFLKGRVQTAGSSAFLKQGSEESQYGEKHLLEDTVFDITLLYSSGYF